MRDNDVAGQQGGDSMIAWPDIDRESEERELKMRSKAPTPLVGTG
jgi:hypothetical protein